MRKLSMDKVTNVVLIVSSIAAAIFFYVRVSNSPGRRPNAQKDEHWKEYQQIGNQMGSAAAPIQIVELADFECPACRAFHNTLAAAKRVHGDALAVTFVHVPLPYHTFAVAASNTAICGGEQGKFEAIHDALYARQSEFRMDLFKTIAIESGVPDTVRLVKCIAESDTASSVRKGLALASTIHILGTPTIFLNGWRLGSIPSPEEFELMISRVALGKRPDRSRYALGF